MAIRIHPAARRWLPRLALLLALAAVTLWVHLYEFLGITQWDSAAFLAIGKLLQRGLLLYRDIWDTKPPGIYLYQSAVFAVLPTEVWSLRLTDYVIYVAAGVLFYRLGRLEAGWPLALAATALWLYLAHHPTFNIAGFYTEEYSAICAIAAVAAAAHYWRRGGAHWVVVSGFAAAAAVIFKHPGAACGLPVLVLISGRRPLRALPLFIVSGALPLGLVVGYFWWHGAIDAFLDCQFLHLLHQHGVVEPRGPTIGARLRELVDRTDPLLRPYPALLWPALFGGAVCLLRPTRFRLAALLWLLADLFFVVMQRWYYEHYYIQVFPSAILVGLAGAAWLLQGRPGERWVIALPRLAACAAAVVFAWIGVRAVMAQRQPVVSEAWAALRGGPASWPRHPGFAYDADLGRYLQARTAADDRIFIFETGSRLAAYWTAERLPASRYLFSIVPQGSVARQAEQIAELERNRPAYVVVVGNPVFRHFTPFLLNGYSLATVKWGGDRVEIWARSDVVPFSTGTTAGLRDDPERGGLALPEMPAPPETPPLAAADARRGTWTSPVVEVIGDGEDLALDWNPRGDLAANPSGNGPPLAEAAGRQSADDPRAVLGVTTRTGRWSIAPLPTMQSLTIRLGFESVADQVTLRPLLTPPDTAASRFQLLGGVGDEFVPLDGTWSGAGDGVEVYRFAPRPLSALRIVALPTTPVRPAALQRVSLPAVGMGVSVRYRSGSTPDLDAVPWVGVPDEEGPRSVSVQRYVQVQCEVWSRWPGRSPVLRTLRIGRLRFQLEDEAGPDGAPLRTAARPGMNGRA